MKLVQPRGKPCFSWQSPEMSKNKSTAANGLHLLYKSVAIKIHSHSSGFGGHFSVLHCSKGRGLGNCGLGLVPLLQIPENFVKQCSDPDQMCQFTPCGGADTVLETQSRQTLMMHQCILSYHLDAETLVCRERPGLGIRH